MGCLAVQSQADEPIVLWKAGDNGVAKYRIPALCTAPDGSLVAACDARKLNGGDLDAYQPIVTSLRRSVDGGKTWTEPVVAWHWRWNDEEQWSAADPSFIVDGEAGIVFLFANVWEWKKGKGVYRFFVQESRDNGVTWSKPREITHDIAFDGWNFGGQRDDGGFIFITSGSGVQMKDGSLMNTLVRVGWKGCASSVALFGSTDHGKTWRHRGNPVGPGDECRFVELNDGSWMINSRGRAGGREIHRSSDGGKTWESSFDTALNDPRCNAQLIRYPIRGGSGKSVLLFSNCNSNKRCNLYVRTSWDDGHSWSQGVCVESGGAAYSDMAILPGGDVGVLFEGAGYSAIKFHRLSPNEFLMR